MPVSIYSFAAAAAVAAVSTTIAKKRKDLQLPNQSETEQLDASEPRKMKRTKGRTVKSTNPKDDTADESEDEADDERDPLESSHSDEGEGRDENGEEVPSEDELD